MKEIRFSFGKNWENFVSHALDQQRLEKARGDFGTLMEGIPLEGRTYIDIGFGQGLSLFFAAERGASVYGIDVDRDNLRAIELLARYFPGVPMPPVAIQSILEGRFVNAHLGEFDIVHSWGVLHHTGEMWKALENSSKLVRPGGKFVFSIYNAHWSSPIWKIIKFSFNKAPSPIQKLMIFIFYPVILVAKIAVTRTNPMAKERGMDFHYDLIDWLGGYPYEWATIHEVTERLKSLGFRSIRSRPASVPTGCNEFVFERI